MKLSICAKCKQQLIGTEPVYITGFGMAEVVGPLVGVALEEVESLEHLSCPNQPHRGD